MSVDYRKSAQEVYSKATEVIIRDVRNPGATACPSFNVICTAYRDFESSLVFPSWVPDWSIPCAQPFVRLQLPEAQNYNAARDAEFLSDLTINNDHILSSKGCFFDQVCYVSKPSWRTADRIRLPDSIDFDKVSFLDSLRVWETKAAKLETYPTGEDLLEVFCRTLLRDAYGSGRLGDGFSNLGHSYARWLRIVRGQESEPLESSDETAAVVLWHGLVSALY